MIRWSEAARSVSVAIALLSMAVPATAQSASSNDTTLYKRLGGYDVIAAVVDDFFARFAADPQLVPFLGGLNAANGARIHQHFVDFLCARTGGPCLYNGRDMAAAHEGMAIEDRHFDAAMRHMSAALEAQGAPAAPRNELLEQLRALRPAIVGGGG